MNIEEAVVKYLLTHPGLKALVSNKIYYEVIPQGVKMPAVVIIKVSDIKSHLMSGISDLERPFYQFTVYAETRATATSIGEQIKSALSDYCGNLYGVEVLKIELQNEMSSIEKTADGTLTVYFLDLEFEIIFIKE